jgi:hypothetical protein
MGPTRHDVDHLGAVAALDLDASIHLADRD